MPSDTMIIRDRNMFMKKKILKVTCGSQILIFFHEIPIEFATFSLYKKNDTL